MRSLLALVVVASSWCACRSGVHHHRHHHHRHHHGQHRHQQDGRREAVFQAANDSSNSSTASGLAASSATNASASNSTTKGVEAVHQAANGSSNSSTVSGLAASAATSASASNSTTKGVEVGEVGTAVHQAATGSSNSSAVSGLAASAATSASASNSTTKGVEVVHQAAKRSSNSSTASALAASAATNASASNSTTKGVEGAAFGHSQPHAAQAAPQQGASNRSTAMREARTDPRTASEAVVVGSAAAQQSLERGRLNLLGPLPADFANRFAVAVAEATGCGPEEVRLLGAVPLQIRQPELAVAELHGEAAGREEEEIIFESRSDVIQAVEDQAADPFSKLANGRLHSFLVLSDEEEEKEHSDTEHRPASPKLLPKQPEIDLAMPYGDLEPFGQEDTAKELTQSSIRESDAMVDQLERAEVAEEKRAIFRALTRLRGAAITSFDGIARSQTGNVDEYAATHQWREEHPVHHLAQDEADVARWAFPEEDSD